ncbi:MAG: hypothetical protein JSV52_12925 [Candidatus Zixiibacteriota bacterium]|nr:MAG: hypothetical protein JSV52_12925 [candidate division Zixibacteria bacterium]
MKSKNKRILAVSVSLVVISLAMFEPTSAQDDTASVAYYVGKSVRRHPDGAVGSATFHGLFQYQLVTKPEGVPTVDIQKYHAELGWVADDYVTLMARFLTVDEDSLRYELNGGLRIYTRNPVTGSGRRNADGLVGAPVVTLGAGIRYNDFAIKETRMVGDISLLLPVSEQLSLLTGYRAYEAIEEVDVVTAYGGVNLYLLGYSADSSYTNPDGPVGYVAFHLTGGGSSNGIFGDLTLQLPINDNLTWKINIRGERVKFPYRRVAIAGAAFSFYPSN